MNLKEKDVMAIARRRASDSKSINWNRKYTIPAVILGVILIMVLFVSANTNKKIVLVGNNGADILVVSDDWQSANINGELFTRDKTQERDIVSRVSSVTRIVSFILLLIIYIVWYKRVRKPYINTFLAYWKEHGELPEE